MITGHNYEVISDGTSEGTFVYDIVHNDFVMFDKISCKTEATKAGHLELTFSTNWHLEEEDSEISIEEFNERKKKYCKKSRGFISHEDEKAKDDDKPLKVNFVTGPEMCNVPYATFSKKNAGNMRNIEIFIDKNNPENNFCLVGILDEIEPNETIEETKIHYKRIDLGFFVFAIYQNRQ